MNIFVINGAARSGKSTFVKYCKDILGFYCVEVSSIDFVKDLARECGWDGTKDAKNRKFLSDLKDLLVEWDDVPYKKVKHQIEISIDFLKFFNFSEEKIAVFIHVREPEEIKKFVDRMGAKTIYIINSKAENQLTSNHADAEVANYKYDYYINNDGCLTDLYNAAKEFCTMINNEKG